MDTARISQATQQKIVRNHAHSHEKSKIETGHWKRRSFWKTQMNIDFYLQSLQGCYPEESLMGTKIIHVNMFTFLPFRAHQLLLGNGVRSQALLY